MLIKPNHRGGKCNLSLFLIMICFASKNEFLYSSFLSVLSCISLSNIIVMKNYINVQEQKRIFYFFYKCHCNPITSWLPVWFTSVCILPLAKSIFQLKWFFLDSSLNYFLLHFVQPLARMGATVMGIDAVDKNIKIARLHAVWSVLK